jgi:hypothetical protein
MICPLRFTAVNITFSLALLTQVFFEDIFVILKPVQYISLGRIKCHLKKKTL